MCGRRFLPPSRKKVTRERLNQLYVWLIVATGATVVLFSAGHLALGTIDVRFLILALITVCIGPRLSIQIPRVKAHISVSDTFVFLSLLLFGGEAAILLATVEALCASLRIGSKVRTHLFNSSVMACATFLTVWTLRLSFGETLSWRDVYSPNYLAI